MTVMYINFFFTVSNIDNGTNRQFEVYKADINCKKFREYHQRVQTFLLWYIDAASFIDVDDDQWSYFNMYVPLKCYFRNILNRYCIWGVFFF